jgi:ribosomal protein L37AE/L43A
VQSNRYGCPVGSALADRGNPSGRARNSKPAKAGFKFIATRIGMRSLNRVRQGVDLINIVQSNRYGCPVGSALADRGNPSGRARNSKPAKAGFKFIATQIGMRSLNRVRQGVDLINIVQSNRYGCPVGSALAGRGNPSGRARNSKPAKAGFLFDIL